MSEELREDRVREVVALLEQARVMGTPAVVGNEGRHVGVMYSATYGVEDDAAENAALEEAFERGHAGGPYIAELQVLTNSDEGREILLEAYKRWQEQDE
jgi:ribosomal protein S12 methylthiotransferase accessory factor YcaO